MNSLPARIIVAAACVAGASTAVTSARSYSLDTIGCLFNLAKPLREERLPRFSLSPLADRIHLRVPSLFRGPNVTADLEEPETARPAEFSANFIAPPKSIETEESLDHWPLFDALRRWQSNPEVPGLSRSIGNPDSYVALDYSDIFETGRAPYKGGHGVSVVFRRNFKK